MVKSQPPALEGADNLFASLVPDSAAKALSRWVSWGGRDGDRHRGDDQLGPLYVMDMQAMVPEEKYYGDRGEGGGERQQRKRTVSYTGRVEHAAHAPRIDSTAYKCRTRRTTAACTQPVHLPVFACAQPPQVH